MSATDELWERLQSTISCVREPSSPKSRFSTVWLFRNLTRRTRNNIGNG